jgi:hypothetical protein
VLGWPNVMPLWMQLRLTSVIGETEMITGISARGTSSLSLGRRSAQILQEIAIKRMQSSPSDQSAARALVAMKDQISDREETAKLLLRISRAQPNVMYHVVGKLALEMLGQERFAAEVSALLQKSPPAGGGRDDFASFVIFDLKPPYGDSSVDAFVDLLLSQQQPGVTWPQTAIVQREKPARFFRRLRNAFIAGDAKTRETVFWILRANVRSPVQDDPSYIEIAREACRMLASDDQAARSNASMLIGPMFPEAVAPVFPEIAALLSSELEWTRRQARLTFVNVRLAPDQESAAVRALCDALRNGRDRGRSLALEILVSRRQLLSAGVDAALLEALERTEDPDLAERLMQHCVAIASVRDIYGLESQSTAGAAWIRIEKRLVARLDSKDSAFAAACRCLGRMPAVSPIAIASLQTSAVDPSRSSADRAAARDALFHIRDRATPTLDPLTPLELAVPK